MNYETIKLEKKNGIAKVILNRPEAKNAMSTQLLKELLSAFEELKGDESIGVVFVKGAGNDFCAGLDLKFVLDALESKSDVTLTENIPMGPKIFKAIEELPMPVIAAVHGHAIAGGLILAYFCDLIIASEDARMGDAHARWGFVPGWQEPQRLARSIGIRRAKQIFLTNELLSAKEAQEIGLVYKVVPQGKLDEAIDELGVKLLKLSKIALGRIKYQLDSVMKTDWQSTLEIDVLMRKDLFGGFITVDAFDRLKVMKK